jgi:apolipoprotein N-acyltransferase
MRASDRRAEGFGAGPSAAWALVFAACFAGSATIDVLWPLALVAPAPLAWLAVRERSPRRAFLSVLAVSLLMWLWLHRWVLQLTPPGYVLLAAYCALYPATFVAIVHVMRRRPALRRAGLTLLVPIVWVGLESLRGELVFDGYPWYLLAHPFVEWLASIQSADLFGTYFVSFLAAMPAGLIVDLALAWRERRRAPWWAAGLVVATWAANLGYGAWRLGQRAPLEPGPAILVVQTNLAQDIKVSWSVEAQDRDLPRIIEQTRAALASAEAPVDLVVWPETMVPGAGFEADTLDMLATRFGPESAHLSRWPLEVEALSRELGVALLVGAPAWVGATIAEVETEEGTRGRLAIEHEYNSAFLIQGRRPYQRYDKYLLTPFGETMPYISHWPWLEERLLSLGAPGMSFSLDRNPHIVTLRLDTRRGPMALATPICYEDTMARVCRRMVYGRGGKRVEVLVNLSNDGWFGWFDGGRAMHNRIARFRCIEVRVPMVRAVNTGQSVGLDSCGRVRQRLGERPYGEANRSGTFRAELPLDRRRTPYGRWGDIWAWTCLALTALQGAWGVAKRT